MHDRHLRCSRRKFLASAAALTLAGGGVAPGAGWRESGNALAQPTPQAGQRRTQTDRRHHHGLSAAVALLPYRGPLPPRLLSWRAAACAEAFRQIRLHRSIAGERCVARAGPRVRLPRVAHAVAEALTDGDKLNVDGVLLIAEHGNYPRNDRQQILYPRYEMMEQIVAVFRKTGKTVPVFNDKHLSTTFAKAKEMVDWSRELKFPFMAGSIAAGDLAQAGAGAAARHTVRGLPHRGVWSDRGLRPARAGSAASDDGAAQGRRDRRQVGDVP